MTVRRPTIAAALLGVALLVAACGDGEEDGEATAAAGSSSTTAGATPPAPSRFCQLLADADGEVEESYLGSARHRAQLDEFAGAAPDEVRPQVERVRDHVREFVDPAVPGSADMERYPDDVRTAIGRIADYRERRC